MTQPSLAPVPATHVLGVFALELRADALDGLRPALDQRAAGELAVCVARDLARLAPRTESLDLVLAAAHFDPAEVLRGGWPLHRRLHELQQRAPGRGQEPRIIAFGADAAGDVPSPFRAEVDLRGGALRVLPFLLGGDADTAREVSEILEAELLDRGMAAADTALAAQDGFGAAIEHARYLTVHDLAAMTALQYRNQGLDALWPILETALLAPDGRAALDAPPEPLVEYDKRTARIALFSPRAWQLRHAPDGGIDPEVMPRIHAMFEARQRQFAAVLRAHGIEVVFDFVGDAAG